MQTVLDPAGPQADLIASLTWSFFGVCAVIYVVVLGAALWAVARGSRRAVEGRAATRRLGVVVAGAVVLTILILVGLAVTDALAGRGLVPASSRGAVTIDVIGHQWWWEFQYHDVSSNEIVNSPNELHLPVGVPVTIRALSRDVIHSFWVPNLRGKRDLIPGIVTHTWIQADRPGVYRGQCAEFCGYQHAHMAFLTVAEPVEQFQSWLQAQRRDAPAPVAPLAQRGHDVFMNGPCVLCHTIRGTQAGSRVGPDLTHLASRRTIAAGTLPNTRGHRAGWIADPQSIKPGSRMPPNLLSGEELQAVLAYLETLR